MARTEIGKEGKLKESQRGGIFWRVNEGGEAEQRGAFYDRAKGGIEHVRVHDHSCHAQRSDDDGGWDARSWTGACTIDWGATSSVCRRPAASDIQPSARLATWCTAAASAVARMVGRKDKVK